MIKYLALGDSYTIGEGVEASGSFPYLFAKALTAAGKPTAEPTVIAKTGWTTDELLAAIEAQNLSGKYELVTLLIGVNNQYRSYPLAQYQSEFEKLLQIALNYAEEKAERVYVLSIPDWSKTPFAEQSDRNLAQIAEEIDLYNQAAQKIAAQYQVKFIDITPITRNLTAIEEPLVEDNLHYAPAMHQAWVNELIPLTLG